MGNPAGVRRDFDALEKRRFAAMRLLGEGLNQSEVARRVKVARQTVARWAQQCRSEGKQALKKAGRAGRKPLLKEKERKRLVERLREGPERLGYETPLWTCSRVAHLIEQEFGILYHKGHARGYRSCAQTQTETSRLLRTPEITMSDSLSQLEAKRTDLFRKLAAVGDFRRGSITSTSGKCGKPNCHCSKRDDRGHGPNFRLTRRVEGKTVTETFPSPAALRKAQQDVTEFNRFEELRAVADDVGEE